MIFLVRRSEEGFLFAARGLGQAHPFEEKRGGIAHGQENRANLATLKGLAIGALAKGGEAGAGGQREGAVDAAQDIGKADRLGRTGQVITARGAAFAHHEATGAQFAQDLKR